MITMHGVVFTIMAAAYKPQAKNAKRERTNEGRLCDYERNPFFRLIIREYVDTLSNTHTFVMEALGQFPWTLNKRFSAELR